MSPDTPTFFVDYQLGCSDTGAPEVSFAFRIADQQLGHESVAVNVRSLRDALVPLLRHESDRRDDALASLPLEVLLHRLEVGVFVYADPGVDSGSDWKRFVRFVALPHCATFYGWSAYLLEDGERARLVWRDPRRGASSEAWLGLGEMDSALRVFHAELDAHLEKPHSLVPRSGERMRSDAAIEASLAARARGR